MHNPQETATLIKTIAKENGISISKMISDCELNKNALYTMQSSGFFPRVEALVKIADYFNISIDYLLGRTKEVHTNDIIELKEETPEETELLHIFRDASIKDRVMLMNYAYNIESKKNNNIIDLPELNLRAAKDDEVE